MLKVEACHRDDDCISMPSSVSILLTSFGASLRRGCGEDSSSDAVGGFPSVGTNNRENTLKYSSLGRREGTQTGRYRTVSPSSTLRTAK